MAGTGAGVGAGLGTAWTMTAKAATLTTKSLLNIIVELSGVKWALICDGREDEGS